jgi:hypothetical protein
MDMKTILIAILTLTSVAVWAEDKVQPLNVKTGLWETTTTLTTSGEMPIPAEFLAKMTPAQRAKMDERMKANAASKTRTNTHKSCETKEKLEKAPFSNHECAQSVLTSSESKAELKVACDYGDVKGTGTIIVEALSPESVKGSGQITASGGGHTINSNSTFTSKWIGSSCGDVQ